MAMHCRQKEMNELRLILIIFGILLLIGIYWIGRREEQSAKNNDTLQNYNQKHQTPITAQSKPLSHKENVRDNDNDFSSTALKNANMEDDDHFYLQYDEDDWRHENYNSENLQLYSETAKPNKARAKIASLWNAEADSDLTSDRETGRFFDVASESPPQVATLPAGIEPFIVSLTLVHAFERNFDPHCVKQSLEDAGLVFGDLDIYHFYRRPNLEIEESPSQKLFSVANMVKPGCFNPQQIDTYNTPGLTIFTQLPVAMDGVIVFEQMLRLGEKLAKQLKGVLCDDKHNKLTQQTIMHIKDQVSEYHLKLRTKLKSTVH